MIRFGVLSFALTIGAAQGVVVSVLLLLRTKNQTANRLLAGLIFAFVLRLVPFIIGYAGVYDAYPWLSFAPFALTLIYGPLIYLYVARITTASMPRYWAVHFIPAAIQLAYYLLVFVQPLPFKNQWDAVYHVPWIDPIETVATLVSLAAYLVAGILRFRRYQVWLKDATSEREEHRLTWLRNVLVAFALTVALNAGFEAYGAFVKRLSYFDLFSLYLWYAILVYYLGMEGWRHANHHYPQPAQDDAPAVVQPPIEPALPSRAAVESPADLHVLGAAWRARVMAAESWRNPELTLADLAHELDMSAGQISRVVNDGLGQNFNEVINRMRVDEVKRRLSDPAEPATLLDIAFDAGFSSKASFNRSFKAYAGMTPTQFRQRVASVSDSAS